MLTECLRELGALGVVEENAAAGHALLCAFFEEAWDRDRLVERVRRSAAQSPVQLTGRVRVGTLEADDWAEAWPEYFVPLAVGRRLFIAPPWMTGVENDRIVIVIEGHGFGTGHHASTAGCLAKLETIVERDRPERAIDLGTGSGLLAIAAARLGVAHVLAVDNDPDAVGAALANAARNGVSDRVRCIVADAGAIDTEAAALVMANLLTPVHARLAARYARLITPTGVVLLGGITDTEAAGVEALVAREGLVVRDRLTFGGWTTLVASR